MKNSTTNPTAGLEARVDGLCKAVMQQVASATRGFYGIKHDDDLIDFAVKTMRSEIKEFVFGPGYESARDCALRRSLSDEWIVTLISSNAVSKILAENNRRTAASSL
jgi:hypothetical protein